MFYVFVFVSIFFFIFFFGKERTGEGGEGLEIVMNDCCMLVVLFSGFSFGFFKGGRKKKKEKKDKDKDEDRIRSKDVLSFLFGGGEGRGEGGGRYFWYFCHHHQVCVFSNRSFWKKGKE